MFILCPQCQFLVAIEPATGLPPARCPRCGQALHADGTAADAASGPPGPATQEEQATAPEGPKEPAMPASALAVDASVLANDSGTAPAGAERAAEPGSPLPSSRTGAPLEASTPAAPAQGPMTEERRKPDKAEKLAKPDKRSGPVKTPGKESKPARLAKPGKDAKDAKAARPGKPAAPARPNTVAATEASQHDAPLAPAPVPAVARRSVAPSFAQARLVPANASPRWQTAATLAGLALLLALQLLLADRARLAADARWRPALASLCGVLRCTLPPWHEPDAFALVTRDVHPARAGVLRVSATFRNDARWPQAWPALHLALQDVDGRTVGARVFAPAEYLCRRVTQNGLAPGQVASIVFDIDEPAGTVVAFTFDFR